jgi:4-hydroxybenzoate polyprenyltransferase/phosphoserine phosphatase
MQEASALRETGAEAGDVPLCVDLDGTLIRSDLLTDGLLAVLGTPRGLGHLPKLMTTDRAVLKQRVAEFVDVDPATLPYNEELLAYLRAEKARGRKLVLATAADRLNAQKIADHLGLFDEVIASDGVRNLKAAAKAEALVARFGERGYSYAGNDAADLPVWKCARKLVLVNVSAAVRREAVAGATVEAEFRDAGSLLTAAARALRPYQWVKNVLVFVPMVTAHALNDPQSWRAGLIVFLAFCATASGIYIINDLSDLAADRRHPRKRERPFASGRLKPAFGIGLALLLLAAGMVLAHAVNALSIVALYAVASIMYSWVLKEFPLVDVFMLAGLYTARIVGGGLATGHPASLWLLAFSGFFFLSLALVKRAEELQSVARSDGTRAAIRRGYMPEDGTLLQQFGCASAFAASVVLALFVSSNSAMTRYSSQEVLWGIVPLMLFWQCRIWLAASRGKMHHDPIVFAAGDKVSWAVVACLVVLFLIAG